VILRRPTLSGPLFELLLCQFDENVSPLTRLAAAEVLACSSLSDTQMSRLLKVVRDGALVSPSVLMPALQRSVTAETAPALLDYVADALRQGWRPTEADLLYVHRLEYMEGIQDAVSGLEKARVALAKMIHEEETKPRQSG